MLILVGTSAQVTLAFIFNSETKPCRDCKTSPFEGQLLLQLAEVIGEALLLAAYYGDHYFCTYFLGRASGVLEAIGQGPSGHEEEDEWAQELGGPEAATTFARKTAAGVAGEGQLSVETTSATTEVGEPGSRQPPWYLWVLPGLADCVANTFFFYAATLMSLTQVQIFKPFRLLLIAVISMAYFQREMKVHCWLGIAVLLLAQVLTALDEAILIANQNSSINSHNLHYGICCCLVGVSLLALELTIFEKLSQKYFVNPIRGIGVVGLVGITATVLLLILAHFTGVENVQRGTYQMTHSTTLLVCTFSNVLSVIFVNLLSLALTALTTSLLAATVLALRIAPTYVLESLMLWLPFSFLGFAAVCLCLLGVLLYSGLPLRWLPPESGLSCFLNARLHLICRVVSLERTSSSVAMRSPKPTSSLHPEEGAPPRELASRATLAATTAVMLINPWILVEKLSSDHHFSPRS